MPFPLLEGKRQQKKRSSSYQRTALVEGKGNKKKKEKKKKAVDRYSCNSYNPIKGTTNGDTGSLKT